MVVGKKPSFGKEVEPPGAVPVQFLPSVMLAWRAPVIARDGLLARATRKALEESISKPRHTAR